MAKKLKTYQKAGAVRDSLNNVQYLKYKAISDSTIKAMRGDTLPTVTSTEVNKGPVKIKGKSGTVTMKPAIATKKMGGAFDKYKSKKK